MCFTRHICGANGRGSICVRGGAACSRGSALRLGEVVHVEIAMDANDAAVHGDETRLCQ